jgi:GWxTD domain-containing protein
MRFFNVLAAALCLIFALVPSPARAQDLPLPKPAIIEADYAVFRSEGGKHAYLEITYAIRREALTYIKSGADSAAADFMVRVNIFNKDSLWAADMWRTPHRIALSDSTDGQRIVNLLRFPIQPGQHLAKLFARDLRSGAASDSVVLQIEHANIANGSLAMSDLELASSIISAPEASSADEVFRKGSLRVIPNPSGIFGAEQPMVFYYLEIYNLRKNLPGSTYRTKCYLATAEGAPVSNLKPREQTKSLVNASVEVGALNISAIPSGTYFLHFELLDAQGNSLQSKKKKVYIYSPQMAVAPTATGEEALAQAFAYLSDEQVAREINQNKYLYDKAESEIYKKLANAPAKREFLAQFWNRYSQQRGAPWREVRQAYLQGVAAANANFSTQTMEGWRTDRGRVSLIYGKPDDVERFPLTSANKPYEIWAYNSIEGGVIFVFADLYDLREYKLLHSTKLGEIRNENWQEVIEGR